MLPGRNLVSVSIPTPIGPSTQTIPTAVRRVSLKKNISWAMLGNLTYAATQWGLLIGLARLGSPESVGRLALGLAVTAPVMLFCNLQLRTVQATDALRRYEFGDYFGLRLVSNAVAFVTVYAISQLGGHTEEVRSIILWLILAKVIESFSDLMQGTLLRREQMNRIAQSQIVRGILSMLVFIAVYAWTKSTATATASLAVSWLTVLLAIDIPMAWPGIRSEGGRIRPRFSPTVMGRLFWMALPLGMVTTLTSVETNLPRYILEQTVGERELGIFASLAYLVFAQGTLIIAVNQSALPRLATLEASGDGPGVRRLIGKMLMIGIGIGTTTLLVCAVAGGPILSLVYGAEYREFTGAFVWVAAAAAVKFASHPFAVLLRAGQQFWILLGVQVLTVAAMWAACLWLIPTQGVNGAAFSLFLSSLLFAALQGGLVALRTRKPDSVSGGA